MKINDRGLLVLLRLLVVGEGLNFPVANLWPLFCTGANFRSASLLGCKANHIKPTSGRYVTTHIRLRAGGLWWKLPWCHCRCHRRRRFQWQQALGPQTGCTPHFVETMITVCSCLRAGLAWTNFGLHQPSATAFRAAAAAAATDLW